MNPNLKMACDAITSELERLEPDDQQTQQELYNVLRSGLDTLTGGDRDVQNERERGYLTKGER